MGCGICVYKHVAFSGAFLRIISQFHARDFSGFARALVSSYWAESWFLSKEFDRNMVLRKIIRLLPTWVITEDRMKLWQRALNNANNAYLLWIISIALLYVAYLNGRAEFAVPAGLCAIVGYVSYRKSRRQFRKLKDKIWREIYLFVYIYERGLQLSTSWTADISMSRRGSRSVNRAAPWPESNPPHEECEYDNFVITIDDLLEGCLT